MPELPEVETTARLLRPDLVGRSIQSIDAHWARSVGERGPSFFRRGVVGAQIEAVDRRAKYVVLHLSRHGAAAGVILVHLRMSGRLYVEPTGSEVGDWVRVSVELDRGVLRFLDVRKFGRITFHEDPMEVFSKLGPEPLEDAFTAEVFRRMLRSRRRVLKPLLLDQAFLAGLGNIYVDEALHRAGIHPLRRADRLGRDDALRLHGEIRQTLQEAIAREGSSFDAFYRTPEGQPGSYQHQFQVYGRAGRECRSCGRQIVRIVVAQRGTHLCTRCQPAPRPRRS